jgi:AcrR family transcriptional regulator
VLILDSLIAEFTLRPPADARISAVVELAGISRGSFYQYFDGMSDAEIAVLYYLGAQRYAELAALIRSGHGDLFSALAQLFRREMERSKDPGFAALLRNLSLPRTFVPAANRAGLPDAPDPLELLSALDLAVFRLPDIRFAMETVDLATGAPGTAPAFGFGGGTSPGRMPRKPAIACWTSSGSVRCQIPQADRLIKER